MSACESRETFGQDSISLQEKLLLTRQSPALKLFRIDVYLLHTGLLAS